MKFGSCKHGGGGATHTYPKSWPPIFLPSGQSLCCDMLITDHWKWLNYSTWMIAANTAYCLPRTVSIGQFIVSETTCLTTPSQICWTPDHHMHTVLYCNLPLSLLCYLLTLLQLCHISILCCSYCRKWKSSTMFKISWGRRSGNRTLRSSNESFSVCL